MNQLNQSEAMMESFLDGVSRELRPHMSPLNVKDTVDELRSHLLASASAHETFGLAATESMAAAIQSLGDSAKLSKALSREEERSTKRFPLIVLGRLAFGSLYGYKCFVAMAYGYAYICRALTGQTFYGPGGPEAWKFGALIGCFVVAVDQMSRWSFTQRLVRWPVIWLVISIAGFGILSPDLLLKQPESMVRLVLAALFGHSLSLGTVLFDAIVIFFVRHFRFIPPRIERI